MSVTALIKITQGATTDVAGRALKGSLGTAFTCTNGDNTNVVLWKWELLYVPPGSVVPLTVQGPSASPSFAVIAPDVAGSYRIRLTVFDGAGGQDVDIRNLCVPFPHGIIAPPFQGNPPPLPLVGLGAKPNEMNLGGQPFGWDGDASPSHGVLLYQSLKILDGLTGGGGPTPGSDYQILQSLGSALAWTRQFQQLKVATFAEEYDNGISGTSKTIDWNAAQKHRLILTANTTLSFIDPPGPGNFMLRLIQDGSGSRSVTWPVDARASGGKVILGGNPNSSTLLGIYFDNTNYNITSSVNIPDTQATTTVV